jgi:hypothetical protein
MKRFNDDDALPAVLILPLVLLSFIQAMHHKNHAEADRLIIEHQATQMQNLRFMLLVATDPVDFRKQNGRKIVDNSKAK